jgi:hypothetical protein
MTASERVRRFRESYGRAEFTQAESEIDRLISEESGVPAEKVSKPGELLEQKEELSSGDSHLFLLEKAMTRVGREDPDSAIDLLRFSRDRLDTLLVKDMSHYCGYVGGSFLDDTAIDYSGADYEHIMVRVILTLCDLIGNQGKDAYAYAVQIGEKQEEILGSNFGAEGEYMPRQKYKRVAMGAYIEGLRREEDLQPGEAAKAYERAVAYAETARDDGILKTALNRATAGQLAAPGHGIIHVFYLAGRGPHLVQTTSVVTELSTRLAGAAVAALAIATTGAGLSAFAQAPVPVPALQLNDQTPQPIEITAGDPKVSAVTESLLDVNEVAAQQLEAYMPWIIARAVVRRALKGGLAAGAEIGTTIAAEQSMGGWAGVAGLGAGTGLNLGLTATERADTRSWSSLPAQVQVARLEVPEGEHTIELGTGASARIAVKKGYGSYVLVLRPDLGKPGLILVDQFSRGVGASPPPAP